MDRQTWHLLREQKGRGGQSQVCQERRVIISQSFLFGVTVRPKLTISIDTNVNSTILNLEDNVESWKPGDTLVVASTDYSMYQAEEFLVLPCKYCTSNQVRVAGKPFTRPSLGSTNLLSEITSLYQSAIVTIMLHNKTDLKFSRQILISCLCPCSLSRVQLL